MRTNFHKNPSNRSRDSPEGILLLRLSALNYRSIASKLKTCLVGVLGFPDVYFQEYPSNESRDTAE